MYKKKTGEKNRQSNQIVTRYYEIEKDPFVHTFNLLVSATFLRLTAVHQLVEYEKGNFVGRFERK